MIELFFFPSPNGIKVAIMLEECGLPYKVTHVDITQGAQFHPDFLEISPNNKIPVIIDHEVPNKVLTLFESGAILLYLAQKSGRFILKQDIDYYQHLQWLFWQIGHLGPMAGQTHYFREFSEVKDSHGIERFTKEMNRLYSILDKQLSNNEYVAGEYSIVDMACWPWIYHYRWQGQELSDFPNIKNWFDKIAERPAVQRAQELGLSKKVDRESYNKVLHNQDAERVNKLSKEAKSND